MSCIAASPRQGQEHIAPGDVISKLRFENFPGTSKTPMHFCACLRSLDTTQLKRHG